MRKDHDGPSLVGGWRSEERSITLSGYSDVIEDSRKVGEEVRGARASTKKSSESREIGTLWRRDPSHRSRMFFLVLAWVEDTERDSRSGVGRGCGGRGQVGGRDLDVDGADSVRARIFREGRGRVQAREEGHHGGGGEGREDVEDVVIAEMENSRRERELQQADYGRENK